MKGQWMERCRRRNVFHSLWSQTFMSPTHLASPLTHLEQLIFVWEDTRNDSQVDLANNVIDWHFEQWKNNTTTTSTQSVGWVSERERERRTQSQERRIQLWWRLLRNGSEWNNWRRRKRRRRWRNKQVWCGAVRSVARSFVRSFYAKRNRSLSPWTTDN